MNSRLFNRWTARVLCTLLALSYTACSKFDRNDSASNGNTTFVTEKDETLKLADLSPAERRALQIEAATPQRFDNHNILYKMIESRAAILYLTYLLPEKGNPYYHMAEFGEKSLKDSFVAGKDNGPELKKRGLFLPKNNGADITEKMLADDKELREVIAYFAQYVATATVLEKVVYPALANSPVILPLADSTSPEVAAKFAKAFGNPKTGQQGHIQYITKKYTELFAANPVLAKVLEVTRKKIILTIASIIAGAMEEHLDHVADMADKNTLQAFLDKVQGLATLNTDDAAVVPTKAQVNAVFDASSSEMKAAEQAFNGVDLPDSGDIDGAVESFEVVMRLDVGFDVLKTIKNETGKW